MPDTHANAAEDYADHLASKPKRVSHKESCATEQQCSYQPWCKIKGYCYAAAWYRGDIQ